MKNSTTPPAKKDTVLFVGDLREHTIEAFKAYNKTAGTRLKILLLIDANKPKKARKIKDRLTGSGVEIVLCNFRSPLKIRNTVNPFRDRIIAISGQAEENIPELKKIIPHFPYLETPNPDSLDWSTDKVLMRRMVDAHNPKLTPKFIVTKEASDELVDKVSRKLSFPVIVKPAGLAGSRLVSICYHEEDLQHVLRKTFRKLYKAYRELNGRGEPQVIIEQNIEGTMYSIDGYVDSKGNSYLCPPVHIKTGKEIGFDDFFGYQQLTPTQLSVESIEDANRATTETVTALSLRSTTFHCELFKTEKGWKIIEIAPRMGGFRHFLYESTYGINHIMNDVLIRMNMKPVIPKKRKGFAVALKFYAKEEGTISKIIGLPKVKKLNSFSYALEDKEVGDSFVFAKNGGGPVVRLFLFNVSRSSLLADIRRAEQTLKFEITPKHIFVKQLQEAADVLTHPMEEIEFISKKAAKKIREVIGD